MQQGGSKASKSKKDKPRVRLSAEEEAERMTRTVFVGNLPIDTKTKAIRRHFAAFGAVEAVRLRSAAAANPKMSKKAAIITRELTGDAIAAYIVYVDVAAVAAAVASNGNLAFGRHLRVDAASRPGESSAATKQHDSKRSVFLGNLPHTISEEALWRLFEPCGAIAYVRLIREAKTQIGKGFGYIGFVEAGSVERALALHGTKVAGSEEGEEGGTERPMRVFRCSQGKSHARLAQGAAGAGGGGGKDGGGKGAARAAKKTRKT